MRTEAGMAFWAALAYFSRLLDDGCFLGEDRAPFWALLDFVFDFLDCCLFGLGRLSSCGFDLGDCLGLDLLRLSLGLDLFSLLGRRLLSFVASLGLDLPLDLD